MTTSPRVEIKYCTQCRWLLRAAWMAQELLTTFESELGEVALQPGTGGIFDVSLDGKLIYSRKAQGQFPESKELKQLIRDHIAPDRPLGHSDRK
uniref:SelT/SelW/SelH family protein n=1 Tax=Catalinimonas niigatensis TaxID=1397264 RepID=UPI003898E990